MINPGKYNKLRVTKKVEFGVYLDGGDDRSEILMPRRYVPEACEVDDELDVFIYFDSEDRIIATSEKPLVTVDECAFLKVVEESRYGAFVDWGLSKDLFVPYREQKTPMREGQRYVVFAAYDVESDRLYGSSRLELFVGNKSMTYKEGDVVEAIVAEQTPMGFKAIIENKHWGLIYGNEVFSDTRVGDRVSCFVKKIREDDKIDLSLQKQGYKHVVDVTGDILAKMVQAGGTINVTDNASPEVIYKTFGVSKKVFKKAIGALYRERLITIDDSAISITQKGKSRDV